MQEFIDCGFQSQFEAIAVPHVERRFRTQTQKRHLAGRREQMGVEVPGIASWKFPGRVDCEINGKAVAVRQLPREASHQTNPLRGREFDRQRDQIFAGNARVLAFFGAFRCVPQTGSISSPRHVVIGEFARQHDFLVQNVLPIGMIVCLAGALIADAFAGAVGNGTRCIAAARTAEGFHVQKIDGHGHQPLLMKRKNSGSSAMPAAAASNGAGTARSSISAAAASLEGMKAPSGSQCSS